MRFFYVILVSARERVLIFQTSITDEQPVNIRLNLSLQFLFFQDNFFSDLLTSALFTPEASISADHKPKYIYLLAYAASVYETWDEVLKYSYAPSDFKSKMTFKLH